MALLDEKDPKKAEKLINDRRNELLRLFNENKHELSHPALIKEEEEINNSCDSPNCLLKNQVIDKATYKKTLLIKWLTIAAFILLMAALILIAYFVGISG
ncbi:hypothetical protein MM26B8_00380 [Mycoplasmopsis meleagridis]|uniref:Uncharacterized protein n=1 Tax=Mycoplasmopsis meleagridis ATCC 25294 TaxID=1264554 RepID=A0A0F5H136_9BACT|nr:hypothetical protein [Mycoplasmopsis meleagridis]KKB26860.1 hypothetical protein MMELEA_05430 [Mycoplasmopsis meleagridis ATCC 25294]KUH47406.1 hypothetical protein ASB56_01715 [Mycoplasmopsis meleagridis]OAD18596.1 hypothetical protein MM26B8_00380 [Mycoplasmopsis meleagridis]VEU77401.1 Uncharacterised protein [Mycoplasmopsis meleagridis]